MPISVTPNQIQTPHSLLFKTSEKVNNQEVYFVSVSGVAVFSFKGNSLQWLHDKLTIHAPLPVNLIPVPPKQGYYPVFKCKYWVVYASLNSIFNQGPANNSGHAVDSFRLTNPGNVSNTAFMEAELAVRDTDAYLFRVGYKVDLLMYFDHYDKIIG